MTKRVSKILLGAALVTFIGVVSFVHARQSPDGKQILDRVDRTYANLKTYQDSGTMKYVMVMPERVMTMPKKILVGRALLLPLSLPQIAFVSIIKRLFRAENLMPLFGAKGRTSRLGGILHTS